MTWLDALTLDTVVVHLKSGTSIKGLKLAVHDDGIVLRDAMVLETEGVQMLNGTPFVPRESVDWMQLVPGGVHGDA